MVTLVRLGKPALQAQPAQRVPRVRLFSSWTKVRRVSLEFLGLQDPLVALPVRPARLELLALMARRVPRST